VTTSIAVDRDIDERVRELIHRSCLRLDEGDFAGWIDLCVPSSVTGSRPKARSDHSPLTCHL
jgi:hypothetical protein